MAYLRFLAFGLFFQLNASLFAQLDTIHWCPPMHARVEWGPQFLYLSTPETQPFQVNIRDGAGVLVTTATISNSQPFALDLGSTNDTKTLVPESLLHQALTGRGLVMDGLKPFYAYFRAHADSERHAGDLTCKGRAALGKTFRIGELLQAENSEDKRSNFIGIMATEDGTVVSLSGYDAATKFRVNGVETQLAAPVQLTLNKGQSAVFSQYIQPSTAAQPPNGFMGTLVTATKPIAINSGSWIGAPFTFMAHDIGIDQIVPLELVGKEYILCKGNGSEALEHPIVVAHFDGTEVFVNGSSVPITTLAAGGWISIPTSDYSAAGNMYIRTSQPVYMYQMVGGTDTGDDQYRTAGLIFVPPLSCGIANSVDNIYLPNQIGTMTFDGGMMITAQRDSLVVLTLDGATVTLPAPSTVVGNPDFVTYRPLMLFSQSSSPKTVSVKAHGAVQVALYGRNAPASFAGFFSGFTKVDEPKLKLTLVGDGVCPDTLVAHGHFDGVQWMYEDSLIQYGPDTILKVFAPGSYIAVGYLGVCRAIDFAADTLDVEFQSPAFPFTFTEPSCFGFHDGSIRFGTPYGGIAPYSFSVNNGKTFMKDSIATGLSAGVYKLVARDSTGCYNRPLKVEITQPDSFTVQLKPVSLPNPLYAGQAATFQAVPDRPIVQSEWDPIDSSLCADCLFYTLHPFETTWLSVTVFDSLGCPATDRTLVEVTPNVFVPNIFNPNSPIGNDVFTLFSKEGIVVKSLSIFDRWGELVFENKNFAANDLTAGWDGTFRGKELDPAVFVWLAEVELLPGQTTRLHGDVTLIR